MTAAILTFQGDIQATRNLLTWMAELGGCPKHDLVLVADAGTSYDGVLLALDAGRKVFKSARIITNAKSVTGWVEGPKSLVLRALRYAAEVQQPLLLMDSDAIPMVPSWLDAIDAEYHTSGRPYMGHIFPCGQPGLPPLLMSPIAVYPPTATELIPLIEAGHHWDVSMTPMVLPQCHHTGLIQHLFGEMNNPPTFARTAVPGTGTLAISSINPGVVLFHRNKDGTLINLLRERLGKPAALSQPATNGHAKSFFQMGRYGDLILLLPAFQEWARRTGQPTVVFTSKEFGSVLEGVSYVKPMKLPHNWHLQAGEALRHAQMLDPSVIRTQLHGVGMERATPDDLESFSLSMWERAGLYSEYHKLPLVFDRRSPEREAALVKQWRQTDKPLLLVNFHGRTSPFEGRDQMIALLCQRLGNKFEFVNTNETNAHRIYDLLGLMDVAAGLITVDTATLHLAAAAKCPYVALTKDHGQARSIPKGRCDLNVGYSEALRRMPEILDVMERWA